jgi:hypothetical protein
LASSDQSFRFPLIGAEDTRAVRMIIIPACE